MLFAHLKLTLQSISKNFFLTMFMMVMFPLIMVPMMSYFNSGSYEQPQEDLNIPVQIVDEDGTRVSDQIRQTLQMQELQGLVEFSEEPDFTITIPKGYAEALEKEQPAEITIDGIVDASFFKGEVLKSVIDTVSAAHQSGLRLERAMEAVTLMPGDTLRIQQGVQTVQKSSVEVHDYEPAIRITAKENFSLQYLQLIFLLFLTSYATAYKQEYETTDLDLRMQSLPVSPLKMQIAEMISGAFQVFVYGVAYILINRILGWGFSGNLLQYTVALFFASFFVAGFSLAFAAVIPPKYATVLGSAVMMFIMFFGGMVGSPQMFYGTPLEFFARLDIGRILTGPFREVNLGTFSFPSLSLFLIGTIVSVGLAFAADKVKKGVLK